jgi:fluoride exporter
LGGELAAFAVACALGGVARFALSRAVNARLGERFPWGTLAVNASGALAIGIVAGLAAVGVGPFGGRGVWLAVVVGFLGCYTTVSAFSLQTLALLRAGERRAAFANVGFSVTLCLAAVTCGAWAARALAGGP